MAESEKREHVLREELLLTQQKLSNCEKVIEKMKDQTKKMETEKMRLQNFKVNKGKRLEELEQKVAQYKLFEKVDVDKLISVLFKQQNELGLLRSEGTNFNNTLKYSQKKNKEELDQALKKFKQENTLRIKALQQVEAMRE
jgi:hypothetical protein